MSKRRKRPFEKPFAKGLENFRPPADLTVSQWAIENRVLSRESSAEAGPWRNERTPYLVDVMDAFTDPKVNQITLVASSQVGKALSIDTPIPTPEGWTTMGELKPGDRVFDENGRQCNVIFATDIMYDHKCYEVTFSDGSKITADAGHKWYVESDKALSYPNGKNRKAVYNGVLYTEEIAKNYLYQNADKRIRHTYAIPVAGALHTDEVDLPLPPYTLGVWLGDGNSYSNQFTTAKADAEIIEYVRNEISRIEVREKTKNVLNTIFMPKASARDLRFCIRGHDMEILGRTPKGYCAECARQMSKHHQYGFEIDPIINEQVTGYGILYEMGLIGNKHIPKKYLRASYEQRLELLRGLMDTDGTSDKRGRCEITLKSERLINDVSELLHTLGIKHTIKHKKAVCTNTSHDYECDVFRISFMVYADDLIPFKLKRKVERLASRDSVGIQGKKRRTTETLRRRIVEVKEVKSVPVKCISVDSDSHLYLAGKSMIPTHNTETEINIIGYIIDQDPGSTLYIQPTLDDAKKFSRIRIAPMIRDSKTLRGKVADVKKRDSGNTILQKQFPGGMLTMIGSNSPAALASTPVRYVIGDELDRWALSAGTEGDPWRLAAARTTTFFNSKRVAVSTPTIKNASKIAELFEDGTRERWCIKCPECGEYHNIVFDNIKFEFDTIVKGRKKDYVIKSVNWACPGCGCLIPEEVAKKQPAKWIAEYPDAYERGHRSFWLNSFASPWQPWAKTCREFLLARNDPEQLKVVFNTMLGELWEDRGDLIDEDTMLSRREAYGTREDGSPIDLPDGVLCLTMAVDTQDDRLEFEVRGWGHYNETWGIYKGFIMGDPNDEKPWLELDKWIDRVYKFEDGTGLKVALTFVDSGGHKTQSVYKQCLARLNKRVFAIKGKGGDDIPFTKPASKVDIVVNGQKLAKTWLYTIGVDAGKTSILKGMINVIEPGAKFCHFPKEMERGYDVAYFAGLLSEQLVMKSERGRTRWVWEKIPGHERNEPLDLFNYNLAAINILPHDFDSLERQLKARRSGEKVSATNTSKPQPKTRKKRNKTADMFASW